MCKIIVALPTNPETSLRRYGRALPHAHSSLSCPTVKEPEERKRILRTSGRCFVCLRRNHISHKCWSSGHCSSGHCSTCRRRHHTSVCSMPASGDTPSTTGTTTLTPQPPTAPVSATSAVCGGSHTPILLQTARTKVREAGRHYHGPTVEVRAILDTRSLRSYVTTSTYVQQVYTARKESHSELMVIKAFCSERGKGESIRCVMNRLVVVPHICDPVSIQPD